MMFFKKLSFEFTKALELGWKPDEVIVEEKPKPTTTLRIALESINNDYRYKLNYIEIQTDLK